MPAWLAMWSTNILFGVLGLAGLRVIGREQSTGRGGGWGDVPKWLRFPALRRSGSERAAEAS
jgi:hypothetical protein